MDRKLIHTILIIGVLLFQVAGINAIFSICSILLAIVVLADKQLPQKIQKLGSNKLFWAAILPFVIFSLSYFYSQDKALAWSSIEVRISLFAFPILIGLAELEKKHFNLILKGYVAGIIGLAIIAMIQAYFNYQEFNRVDYLYNDLFVSIYNKQAVYFAFYINLAWLFLIYLWHQNLLSLKAEKVMALIAVPILFITQYLLASRMSMATFGIFTALAFVFISVKRMSKMQIAGSILGLLAILVTITHVFPDTTKRFVSIQKLEYRFDNPNPINHLNGKIKEENWNGLNTRLALWACAKEVIIDQPIFGYGIGDVMEVLNQKYIEKNFLLVMNKKFSCHSQYLNSWLTAGFFGFSALLIYLFAPLFYGFKNRNWLMVGFIVIVSLAFVTEILFSRDQGAIILGVLYGVIVIQGKNLKSNLTQFGS